MSSIARLQAKDVQKAFSGVQALADGWLTVEPGQVHALMGANGAGKSTFMNILGGVLQPDQGEIQIDGKPVSISSTRAAGRNGIAFVHQELTMLPSMSVAENIFIDEFPTRGSLIDRKLIHQRSRELLDRVGCRVRTDAIVETLSTGERQLIEIARALKNNPRIFILDEPTSSLSGPERLRLFEVVRALKKEGTSVVYISHFLDEVFEICDAVTVMRNGCSVWTRATGETNANEVLKEMLGQIGESERIREPEVVTAKPLVSVRNLSSGNLLSNISFDLAPGEIVGLWGLLGSGRTELIRALMGLDAIDSGDITFRDGEVAKPFSPKKLRNQTGLVTEDRRGEGLLLPLSIGRNIALTNIRALKGPARVLSASRESEMANQLMRMLGVKASGVNQPVGTLSGGNQQKVVFARWLPLKPKLFILDEPTRGLDVGAKSEILKLTVELARSGASILLVSSELEEIMRVSDRYLVINRGRITGHLPGDASKDELMDAVSSDVAQMEQVA
jgi:ABC-type sugar transport system ATPase subunit